jgi:hypothetical protein
MLRLGRKYDITTFEKEALERLHHDCPTQLEMWDALEISSQTRQTNFDACDSDFVIPIAHEFRLFTILPAAYIKFLQCRTLVTFFQFIKINFFSYSFSEQMGVVDVMNCSHFSKKMRERFILGHARIQKFVKEKNVDALCPPLVLPSKTCYGGATCEANKWKAIRSLPVWSIEDEDDCPGIFFPWGDHKYSCWGYLSPEVRILCLQCQSAIQNLTDKVRGEFWSILPTLFDLPAWADLKDEL